METRQPALEVAEVRKTYDRKIAVDGVSLTVEPGEVFGLLGPNGAGKTSLIRMIMDIIRPDSGTVRVLGQTLTPEIKDRMGYLPEERGLYQKLKVLDVLVFLGQIKGLKRHVAAARAEAYLDRFGLFGARRRNMRELSKGMQQKVQLAAVLLHEPVVVVLDEPFMGLDPLNRELVIDLIKETASRGAAIVLSTHLMDQVEALCTRAFLIHEGRGILSGSVREMRERYAENAVLIETDAKLEGRPEVERAVGGGERRKVFLRVAPE
ncbi:MAG: ATP-binding cassette domain-containing protein, partial [Planctomycetes bacterium]|nr:ATP-binding cassette domain-containing protein [Planctomycetota bacterium]